MELDSIVDSTFGVSAFLCFVSYFNRSSAHTAGVASESGTPIRWAFGTRAAEGLLAVVNHFYSRKQSINVILNRAKPFYVQTTIR